MSIVADDKQRALRRVAVLLLSLDECTARSLLEQLSEGERDQLRGLMENMEGVGSEERNAIVQQFVHEGRLREGRLCRDVQIDTADEVSLRPNRAELNRAEFDRAEFDRAESERTESHHPAGTSSDAGESLGEPSFDSPHGLPAGPHDSAAVPWSEAIPPRTLASLLQDEHPQTLAAILTRMPPDLAADFLGELPARQQVDVARRVADLGYADPDILADIEVEIAERLAQSPRVCSQPVSGNDALQSILLAATRERRTQLVDNIAGQDLGLATKLGLGRQRCQVTAPRAAAPRPAWTPRDFDELCQANDGLLTELFHALDPTVAALALIGSDSSLTQRVLRLLPVDRSETVRREMATLVPVQIRDIDRAQAEVLQQARERLANAAR